MVKGLRCSMTRKVEGRDREALAKNGCPDSVRTVKQQAGGMPEVCKVCYRLCIATKF